MPKILGINPEEPITKVLKCTRDWEPADQVRYTTGQMNAREYARYQDALIDMSFEGGGKKGKQKTKTVMKTAELSVDLLCKYLLNLENYYYPEAGQPKLLELSPVSRFEARKAEVSRIAPDHRREIAETITGDSDLDEEDEKN